MRAWLPERQVYGPEPAGERDTDALNRVFADAFTDRYRRDGLVGVRVPHLNPQVWRYALLDAGAGALTIRPHGQRAHPALGTGAVRDVEGHHLSRFVPPQHGAGTRVEQRVAPHLGVPA